MESLYMLISFLIFALILIIVLITKPLVKSIENRIFKIVTIINLLGLVIEILLQLLIMNYEINSFIVIFFARFYLYYLIIWLTCISIYTFVVSYKNSADSNFKKYLSKVLLIHSIVAIILLILSTFLNIEIYYANGDMYSFGASVKLVQISAGLFCSLWLICIFSNIKEIKAKKYYPIIVVILCLLLVTIIQISHPEILLATVIGTFVNYIMYFTIENPDMKMIEQLNYERDRADKANQAKSEFLSSMSHEIRTPLNAIVGFSEALRETDLPDDAKDEVNDIIMASESLVEIVNGILDISKIEANKLEIINVPYSFKKIFDDLVVLTKARMGDKPLDFRVSYDDSIPGVLYGDASRLKQIILNLLTNAVKYTNTGYFEFKVNSVIKDDICRLIISVEDSGIGIKKESIDKLFTKFERLQVEKQTTVEGTGLGLAITKKLVELMNGKIVVQSEYGKGSKFTVAIDQYIIKREVSEVEETKKEELEIINASNKKILVVDDNIVNLKVATRLLLKYKAVIDTATSGNECIDKVMDNHYDLILMDDMMPKMSGTETLNNLKEIKDFNIPTVALTANAISGMKEKYLNEGFSDYLSKPIELKELNRVIIKFLK